MEPLKFPNFLKEGVPTSFLVVLVGWPTKDAILVKGSATTVIGVCSGYLGNCVMKPTKIEVHFA